MQLGLGVSGMGRCSRPVHASGNCTFRCHVVHYLLTSDPNEIKSYLAEPAIVSFRMAS